MADTTAAKMRQIDLEVTLSSASTAAFVILDGYDPQGNLGINLGWAFGGGK